MADLTRPDFGEAWASEGEKLSPDSVKIKLGWVQEMMPYQFENFLQSRQDQAILYLLQKGVPEYSPTQEYTANKSVVVYQGNLYMATATVTGVLPTVTASWKRISPTVGTNGAVSISSGGTGATSVTEARTNLGLGTASVANLPSTNGVVVRSADNTLISRLLTGTSGNISITNPDGVAGNININVGTNVAQLDKDSSWTSKGGITLPKGSSSERGVEVPGKIRYNTELQKFEGYNGTSWNALGATSEVEITTLSGDGVTTSFTLNVPAFSESSTDVYIGGIYQNKGTYSIGGTTLSFSEAPTPGTDNIQVVSRRVVDLGIARASQVSIEDAANLYTSTTVEGALREAGDKVKFVKNAILSYPDYAAASTAAATLPDGQVVSTDDPPASYSVSAGSLLERRSNRKLVNIAEWISPVMVDITEAVRAAHVFANLYALPVSYAGVPLIRIQANAKIPVKTNVDFCGAELEILDGYVPNPSWSTFNTAFIVSDDACPLISVTGSVLASNLKAGSLYPTLGLFDGHGYAKITCGFQVPNRLKTGTQNYTQSFKINRNGRASLPLSTDISAYADSIQVEYRNTSKSRLVIKNLGLSEGTWNNQRVFDIQRCNTVLENFTLLHNNQSFNNICEIVNISNASDVVINDYVTTGRVITESEGSYSLSINGGADIRVNRMNSLEGWGSTGTNNVNGLYFKDSTINRIDGHDSAHNMFADNCDVHHYGITYGWGGGVISAKNSRFHRCTPIQNRSDWGGTFFGAIIVDGVEVENNFSASITIVDLESTPLGASTPVTAPSVIAISDITRTGGAPSLGGEIIAARVKVAGPDSIVYAPTVISCTNIRSTLPRWRFGMRVDLLNMEGVSPNFVTRITVDGVPADYAAGSVGNIPNSGILDFDQVRTPSSPVRTQIRFSNCENVAILCRSSSNVDIRGFSSGINALSVNKDSAQKPVVIVDACRFLALPIGATTSQIGASNSGFDRYTVVRNSEIANFAFDFSLVAAMVGNTIRQGGTQPTLPSGCTPELAFSGWRKSGVFS